MNYNYINDEHYKTLHKIYNIIKNKNHPGILLYGDISINKQEKFICVLNDIYPSINYENKYKDICYKSSDIYYTINCKNINEKQDLITFIKEIISTYNHYSGSFNYIILYNFEYLEAKYNHILKVIIEKSYLTSRFILITNKLTVNANLKSHLICINFPLLMKYNNDTNIKYIDPLKKIINKILHIYNTNISLKLLRDISYKIKEMAIPNKKFLRYFMDQLNTYYPKNIFEIVEIISYFDKLFNHSFRDIIYYESLFIKIYKIIKS
jgi:hypothetical protein